MAPERRSSRLKDTSKSMKETSDSDDSSDERGELKKQAGPINDAAGGAAPKMRKGTAGSSAPQERVPAAARAGGGMPPRPKPKAAGRRTKRDAGADLHGLSLMEVLGKHPEAVPRAAKELVKDFQDDASGATARLMTLIAHTAGYDEEFSTVEIDEGEVDALVRKMADYVIQNTYINPLHDKRLRAFPDAYQRFWLCLVSELYSAGLVLEDFLVDRLRGLVISLSCSSVQPFRLAGTLTASHIMSGWVEVQKLMTRDLSQMQFQVEAESKKRPANKGLLNSLKRQLEQQHRQSNDLETVAKSIITSVFAVRFRDTWAEVRATVIHSFAHWIDMAPEAYLADAHLKYLGWALSDPDPAVRLEAVSGVSQLYKGKENVLGLHDFTVRFLARFREMIRDKDEVVSEHVLGLLARLVEVGELDQEIIRDDVYALLGESSEVIRVAAADLVASLLLDSAAQHAKDSAVAQIGSPASGGRGRKAKGAKAKGTAGLRAAAAPAMDAADQALRSQLLCLFDLLATLRKGGSADGVADVAELSKLLAARLPVLRDWRALSATLVDDDLLEARGDGVAGELAVMLMTAVMHAIEGVTSARAASTAAGQAGDEASVLSLEMVGQLPRLLGKHQADAGVTCALLRLVPLLRLDAYGLSQETRAFNALLSATSEALQRHAHDPAATAAAAWALVACAERSPGALKQTARLALSKASTLVAEQLKTATNAVQALRAQELREQVVELAAGRHDGAEELFHLQCALVRVVQLLRAGASVLANQPSVYEALNLLLEECQASGRRLGSAVTELVAHSMVCTLGLLLVDKRAQADQGPVSAELLDDLRERSANFIGQLSGLHPPSEPPPDDDGSGNDGLDEESQQVLSADDDALRMVALHTLADALTLFTGETWSDQPLAEAIPSEAPDNVLRALWGYVAGALDMQQARIDELDAELGDEDAGDSGNDTEPGPSPEVVEERGRCVSSQLRVVSVVAQLLHAPRTLGYRHFRWLAAHLVSRMMSYGPEVSDLLRELFRELRAGRSAIMPEVYMGAMKLSFSKVLEEEEEEAAKDDDEMGAALYDFSELSKSLAHMYIGHNIHREELLRLARAGLTYTLTEPPTHFEFAAWGLGHFTGKLAQEDASTLVGELEESIAGLPEHEPSDEEWAPLYQYLSGLKDRVNRGAPRGAMKGARAAAAAAPRPRKISFAAEPEPEEDDLNKDDDGSEDDASRNALPHGGAGLRRAGSVAGSEDDGTEGLPAWRPRRRGSGSAPAEKPAHGGGSLRHTYSGDGNSGLDLGDADLMTGPEREVEQTPARHVLLGGHAAHASQGLSSEHQLAQEDVRDTAMQAVPSQSDGSGSDAQEHDDEGGLALDIVQEASQVSSGGVEPPPRPKRRRRI